jgi:hypothetical protein
LTIGTDATKLKALPALALLLALAVLAAGCGGGGSSSGGSSSDAEVVAKIETACAKVAGYSVWLPEHQQKEALSVKQLQPIVDKAGEEFDATLEALEPPADLQAPVEEIAAFRLGPSQSRKQLAQELTKEEALYRAAGADRCAKGVEASLLTINGMNVEAAYKKVGLPLPPKPAGW